MFKKYYKKIKIVLIFTISIIIVYCCVIWGKPISRILIKNKILNKHNAVSIRYLQYPDYYSYTYTEVPWGISKIETKLICFGKLVEEINNKLTFEMDFKMFDKSSNSDNKHFVEYYYNKSGKFYKVKEIYSSRIKGPFNDQYKSLSSYYQYHNMAILKGFKMFVGTSKRPSPDQEIITVTWKEDNQIKEIVGFDAVEIFNNAHPEIDNMFFENDLFIKYEEKYKDDLYLLHTMKKDGDSETIREFSITNNLLKD